MCLLILGHRVREDAPLVIAANRDEFLARPAAPMTVLREANPRTVGGRDLQAQGTWLATTESGLVVGLTNKPGSRFPNRKSRGELPLLLTAAHDGQPPTAKSAVERLSSLVPQDYNPCWLLIADAHDAFYVDFTQDENGAPVEAVALAPGVHVLENRPIAPPSSKAAFVLPRAEQAFAQDDPVPALLNVLASHDVADAADDPLRPDALRAACVHYGPYGTRSANVIVVPPDGTPRVHYTDEASCQAVEHGRIHRFEFAS